LPIRLAIEPIVLHIRLLCNQAVKGHLGKQDPSKESWEVIDDAHGIEKPENIATVLVPQLLLEGGRVQTQVYQ
jgi:hypothetical protein